MRNSPGRGLGTPRFHEPGVCGRKNARFPLSPGAAHVEPFADHWFQACVAQRITSTALRTRGSLVRVQPRAREEGRRDDKITETA